MNYNEKRAHSRVSKRIKIGLSEDSLVLETETKNISVSGINCQVSRDIPIMTRLKIQLKLPLETATRAVNCSGVVVRCVPMAAEGQKSIYNVAIFIDDINESHREVLKAFVASNK